MNIYWATINLYFKKYDLWEFYGLQLTLCLLAILHIKLNKKLKTKKKKLDPLCLESWDILVAMIGTNMLPYPWNLKK